MRDRSETDAPTWSGCHEQHNILEDRVGALELISSLSCTQIAGSEWQLTFICLEMVTAAKNWSSTECHPWLAEDTITFIHRRVKGDGEKLHQAESVSMSGAPACATAG